MITPLVVIGIVGAGAVLSHTQPDPGNAVWSDTSPTSFTGILAPGPYPVLFTRDRGDGTPGFMLVVEPGKHGSSARLAPFAGQGVTLQGTLLRRNDGRMIDLDESDRAIALSPSDHPALPPIVAKGRVMLRGEIVDSKCFLGAMKPGSGRTHKECATLCIKGGIPPTLIFEGPNGSPGTCLLIDRSGGPLDPGAFPFIADRVEVFGDLEEQGGLLRLRVTPLDIRRL
jgi:hypothetical protein